LLYPVYVVHLSIITTKPPTCQRLGFEFRVASFELKNPFSLREKVRMRRSISRGRRPLHNPKRDTSNSKLG